LDPFFLLAGAALGRASSSFDADRLRALAIRSNNAAP
jgi:hypothetical protein